MADVFISYAKADRETALSLAAAPTTRGYEVWWDYDLVGGDEFRKAILDELQAAKAVIVIWTDKSVSRAFVLDEASQAQDHKKLISVCSDGFDTKTLPLGFRGLQCHPVSDIDKTIKAITKLQAVPEAKNAPERVRLLAEEKFWSEIENSANPGDFKLYLDEYPNGVHRALAKLKLSRLGTSAAPRKDSKADEASGPGALALLSIWSVVTLVLMYKFGEGVFKGWNGSARYFEWAVDSFIYAILSVIFMETVLRREGGSLQKSKPSGFWIWAIITSAALLWAGIRVWVDATTKVA
jgi:hypothetical protein